MSTYDSPEPRSNFGLFVFLAIVAAALIGIGSYLFRSIQPDEPDEPAELAERAERGRPSRSKPTRRRWPQARCR